MIYNLQKNKQFLTYSLQCNVVVHDLQFTLKRQFASNSLGVGDFRVGLKVIFMIFGISRMSFKDFSSNYERLEICFLGPDSLADFEEKKGTRKWEGCLFEGAWHRRVNAGGCSNFKCKLRLELARCPLLHLAMCPLLE